MMVKFMREPNRQDFKAKIFKMFLKKKHYKILIPNKKELTVGLKTIKSRLV